MDMVSIRIVLNVKTSLKLLFVIRVENVTHKLNSALQGEEQIKMLNLRIYNND